MTKRQWRIGMACAALAVLAMIAGAVYGIPGLSGNGNPGGDSACGGSRTLAAALEGLNTGQVAAFQPAAEPVFVGDLSFFDGDGKPTGLADHRGQTVLLNLWATWCVPCREEMPALAALQRAMGGEGFQVLPVSVDIGGDDKPKAFYAERGLGQDLPFRHEGSLAVFNRLKQLGIAFGMPATALVDGQGCAIGWMNGPADWASADARRLVAAALPSG